jgi:DNA-binding CsgD family transcriptional regulator
MPFPGGLPNVEGAFLVGAVERRLWCDATGMAAILLDDDGEVLRANANAELLFGREFAVRRRRIFIAERTASEEVARAIHRVLDSSKAAPRSGPVPIHRDGRRPIILYVMRLERQNADLFSRATALILLIDLEVRPAPKAQDLCRIFGLTPSEAEFASSLSAGASLSAAADQFEITSETARKRLKSIFQKTDTHRQGELVALMAQLARGL